MTALAGIATNAYTEAIRQPIYAVMLLAVCALLVLNPALTARHTISQTGDEFDKLLIDLGLSLELVAGLVLASFVAAGVLSRELDNRTALTVISKPVGRPVFILGKFVGVLAAVALAYWIWSLVFLLTVRHRVLHNARMPYDWPVIAYGGAAPALSLVAAVWCNFFYRWVFGATLATWLGALLPVAYLGVLATSREWAVQALGTDWNPQLAIAILLVFEALAVIVAIAVAVSTRLGPALTLVACALAFVLGTTSDFFLGRYADTSFAMRVAYALPLNTQFHWLADALSQGHPVSVEYVMLVTLYSAAYATAALAVAVALFQTREIG